jgi:hypothetical protein
MAFRRDARRRNARDPEPAGRPARRRPAGVVARYTRPAIPGTLIGGAAMAAFPSPRGTGPALSFDGHRLMRYAVTIVTT